MRQLIYYIRTYLKEHFHAGYFAVLALFLAISVWYNYKIDFENSVLDSFQDTWKHLPAAFAFYAVPYYFAIFAYALFYRRHQFLKKTGFWVVTLLGVLVMAINETFYWHRFLFIDLLDSNNFYFARKVSNNLISEVIFFIPLIIYWRLKDSHEQPLYGFNSDRIDLKPYFGMMLLMLPLISWASFQDDFLRMYPTYRPEYDQSQQYPWHFVVYQIFYGIDFIGVEFFYRGFLILALVRYLGAGAIMPMVCMYAYMHFGKPMGETIGSIFGGTILGILAYYSRSIYGGIIIHLGVAYMMELTAFLQTYLRSR